MYSFFFDASALAKRYHQESGSEVVSHLLDDLLPSAPERVAISPLNLSETVSVLTRHHNTGRIPTALFQQGMARVLLEGSAVNLPSVDTAVILNSIPLISRHNINASDALYLHQALNLQRRLEAEEHELVLVASDQHLLRAAENEGLMTLNPEEASIADAEALLRANSET
ncbi:MAG: type II toxin-antitoxin system VapC family toxin [Ardenticatenaceae bacterium]|nr:type II toxin-antitoxin system VapC family toxin [Ardenticatenaceae bacterium]